MACWIEKDIAAARAKKEADMTDETRARDIIARYVQRAIDNMMETVQDDLLEVLDDENLLVADEDDDWLDREVSLAVRKLVNDWSL